MAKKAFQDCYPDDVSLCYGCGKNNEHGLQIKSYWDGDETYAIFNPKPYHTAMKGYVYGGLIASLIDCHGTGTASAAMYKKEGREMDTEPAFRFVTASLHVDFLKPTPIDGSLEIRGKIEEMTDRKVVVSGTVSVNGKVCAKGKVVAVLMPDSML